MLHFRKHTGLKNKNHWGFSLVARKKLARFFWRFDFSITQMPYKQSLRMDFLEWSNQTNFYISKYIINVRWF